MKRIMKIVVSVIYILWGIGAPLSAIHAIMDLNLSALISAGVGIIMLLAGIFGLFHIKPIKRRIFGIIIFVGAVISLILSLESGLQWQPIVTALLAWIYII